MATEGGRDRYNSRFRRIANSLMDNRFKNRVNRISKEVSHSTSAVAIEDAGVVRVTTVSGLSDFI